MRRGCSSTCVNSLKIPCGSADARASDGGVARLPHPAVGHRQAGVLDSKPFRGTAHRYAIDRRPGHRRHVHPDVTGLALPRRGARSLLAKIREMGSSADHLPRSRPQQRSGRRPATPAARNTRSLGARSEVRRRWPAALLPGEPSEAKHEPKGQLLKRCFGETVVQQPQECIRKQNSPIRELDPWDIASFIEALHNRMRRNSHLGGVSPE